MTSPDTGLPDSVIAAIQQLLASYPEVETAMLDASITHPALQAHIERVGKVLYRRADLLPSPETALSVSSSPSQAPP
ncbi:hypothetical protein [Cyanobium sp. CH-040]|uniref:hypothetical protein n=1 Tax=Cyanobium sp. CH-040 TaxID=2823708 RepID=UPI0020CE2F90|nr:hypothetical protein [Cyanobium sp. CH-040]MCP9927829.1 hypothetical protein [Cyanobium sp. CH-040]